MALARATSMTSPEVIITELALRAFHDAASEVGNDELLRLTIDSKFRSDLYFGPQQPNDVVIAVNGLRLAMDARTARRANGLTIDYVDTGSGFAFKLDNPNQSSPVKGICPADVVRMLERHEEFRFIDARSESERARARVEAARPLDASHQAELALLPKNVKLVFMAHHGSSGRAIALRYHEQGFSNVWYVAGGIDAWSTMDPSIPRY